MKLLRGQKFVQRFRDYLQIGPLVYKVFKFSVADEMPHADLTPGTQAAIWPYAQVLYIRKEQGSGMQAADSVLHEIAHGITNAFVAPHIITKEQDEVIASAMGTGFAMVFRDNPWLLDWLKAATKDG